MASQRWLGSCVAVAGMVVTLSAQTPAPTFELASVTARSIPGLSVPSVDALQKNVVYRPATRVIDLVRFAYDIQDAQLLGGPDWIRRDLFEVNARAVGEVPTEQQMRLMVKSLLEDRFKLMAHSESREMRFSAVTVARADGELGPGITPCSDPERLPRAKPIRKPPPGVVLQYVCVPIAAVANLASDSERVPVVDRTGLNGMWTFAFSDNQPTDQDALPPFSTGLQEQLGFKLESTRGPVDVLVIDSVERLAEN